jgi:hypothetical protein
MSTNKSNETELPTKNLWCRDARVQEIIRIIGRNPFTEGRGYHIRSCTKSDCKGAHKREEIIPFEHIHKWDRIMKANFNFIELYNQVLNTIKSNKDKIKQQVAFKSRLDIVDELTFIELIQLWKELTCFHRKLTKERDLHTRRGWQSKEPPKPHSSGYCFQEDVPKFYLEDPKYEDHLWAFERITRYCETQRKFVENIKKGTAVTIWDICLGDKNCKEGFHYIDESLCIDNFLTGKCECMTKQFFDEKQEEIETSINNLEDSLKNEDLKPKRREQLKVQLSDKYVDKRNHQRKIHYTEDGMKPFNQQLAEYKTKKAEETVILKEKEDAKEKPTWDHKISKTDKTAFKVIKIAIKK